MSRIGWCAWIGFLAGCYLATGTSERLLRLTFVLVILSGLYLYHWLRHKAKYGRYAIVGSVVVLGVAAVGFFVYGGMWR